MKLSLKLKAKLVHILSMVTKSQIKKIPSPHIFLLRIPYFIKQIQSLWQQPFYEGDSENESYFESILLVTIFPLEIHFLFPYTWQTRSLNGDATRWFVVLVRQHLNRPTHSRLCVHEQLFIVRPYTHITLDTAYRYPNKHTLTSACKCSFVNRKSVRASWSCCVSLSVYVRHLCSSSSQINKQITQKNHQVFFLVQNIRWNSN